MAYIIIVIMCRHLFGSQWYLTFQVKAVLLLATRLAIAFTIQPPHRCFVKKFMKVIANLVAWCYVKHILCVEQSISDRSTSHPMPRWPWVWETFYKEFVSTPSKYYKNLGCFYLKNNDQIRSKFCTCHDSSAVVTWAKFWPDLIINFITKARKIFTRFQQWAHKPCGKWVPGSFLMACQLNIATIYIRIR